MQYTTASWVSGVALGLLVAAGFTYYDRDIDKNSPEKTQEKSSEVRRIQTNLLITLSKEVDYTQRPLDSKDLRDRAGVLIKEEFDFRQNVLSKNYKLCEKHHNEFFISHMESNINGLTICPICERE
jgi:hypothetical protein